MEIIHTFSDGGATGNPGPSAIGVVLKSPDGTILVAHGEYVGDGTNNQAEYKALKKALELALKEGHSNVIAHLDSELVVKQMKGEYKVKDVGLAIQFAEAKALAAKFDSVKYTHIRREFNSEADALVNKILDEAGY